MKKFISVFLTVCIVLSTFVAGIITVSAEGNQIESSDVTWSFNSTTNELRFDGTGSIPDYNEYMTNGVPSPKYPWKDLNYVSIVFGEGITGIGNYAFSSSKKLKNVEIPDTVTVLGNGVFYGCENLETVTLPSEVTEIGENMFMFCSDLSSVTLGAKTASIGSKAFFRCENLESITFPTTLKTIGFSAFEGCSALTSLVIPEGTTSIGERSFFGCEGVETLSLPSTLESIGVSAFNECTSLESVAIPEKITVIPTDAFYSCESLTSVTFPEGLVEIQENAFYRCLSLASVEIPSTVKTFGKKALGYGKLGAAIKNFTISGYYNSAARLYAEAESKFKFESKGYILNGKCGETATWEYKPDEKTLYINGTGAIADCTKDDLVLYNLIDFEKIVISEEITKIGAYAFFGAPAVDFALSRNLTEIGEKAIGYYLNNKNKETLRDGTSITAYEETVAQKYATDNKVKFNTLGKFLVTEGKIGDNATWSYNKDNKILYIDGTGATYNFTQDNLAEYADYDILAIVVRDGITAIGDYAFVTTKNYESIVLGKNIESIGKIAFGHTKEFIPDENGNPTDEVACIPNSDLLVKGYLVTPADEYAKEYEFAFDALDGDEYIEFSFNVPSVTDHLNKFIYAYATEVNIEEFTVNFDEAEATVAKPEKIASGSVITFVKGETIVDYRFVILGDTNGDGKIASTDALIILKHTVGSALIEGDAKLEAGDIDNNGKINATDALIALQFSVGKAKITDYYNPGKIA